MLDLETMGTEPGCAIVSIGAVQFDLLTGKLGKKFYASIDLSSCLNVGLTVSGSTIMWWMQQGPEARAKLLENPTHIMEALTEFTKWVQSVFGYDISAYNIWGNSAAFDCGILSAAYDKLHLARPYSPWNERCFRTVKGLFPRNLPKKDSTKAHDPIYDCEYQITVLSTIIKSQISKLIV